MRSVPESQQHDLAKIEYECLLGALAHGQSATAGSPCASVLSESCWGLGGSGVEQLQLKEVGPGGGEGGESGPCFGEKHPEKRAMSSLNRLHGRCAQSLHLHAAMPRACTSVLFTRSLQRLPCPNLCL